MQTTKKNILTQNNGLDRAKAQKRKDKRSQLPRVDAGRLKRWLAVWPDLVKFRHFGKIFKYLGKFLGFIYYLAKFWTYFCMLLGKFSLM